MTSVEINIPGDVAETRVDVAAIASPRHVATGLESRATRDLAA